MGQIVLFNKGSVVQMSFGVCVCVSAGRVCTSHMSSFGPVRQ